MSIKKLFAALTFLLSSLSFAAVDVNTGSAADLDSVKGIGPSTSKRILEERAKGPFKDWGDLIARVKGVGTKSAAKLSTGGLTVNGAAYDGKPAAAKAGTKEAKPSQRAAAPESKPVAPAKP
jgi:competence protein ComEA